MKIEAKFEKNNIKYRIISKYGLSDRWMLLTKYYYIQQQTVKFKFLWFSIKSWEYLPGRLNYGYTDINKIYKLLDDDK